MTSTTFAEFNSTTEGSTVTSAFPTSVKDRTILITGVNKLGIGYATTEALAAQSPRRLILSGRSEAKLNECLGSLRAKYPDVEFRPLVLDLGSQKSVRRAATEVLGWEDVPAIDLVINNAGVMNIPERTLSEDGIELQLATNYVGHFLLTSLVMSKIITSAKAAPAGATRIVNVSSMSTITSPLRASDINWERPASQLPEEEKPAIELMKSTGLSVDEGMSYIPLGAYGQSKTALILHSIALNERLYEKHGVLSFALNPGEVRTELQRTTDPVWFAGTQEWRAKNNVSMKTVEQGSSTTLVAALDPQLGRPNNDGYGLFLDNCQISSKVPPYALDKTVAEKLWGMTEGWVKEKFSW